MNDSPAAILCDVNGVPLAVDNTVLRVGTAEAPVFVVTASAVQVANNKSVLALTNSSVTHKIRLQRVYMCNAQTVNVSGITAVFTMSRITTKAGGTSLAPLSYDSSDVLPGGVTAATGAVVAGEGAALNLWRWSTDEWGSNGNDGESALMGTHNSVPVYSSQPGLRPITARNGEGVHVKFATNSTVGSWDVRFVFTVEPV